MTQPKPEKSADVEMEEAVHKPEDATEEAMKEEDNKVTEDDDDDDSEDGLPVKKLAALKNYGKGTPATKVKMGRKSATPSQSPLEKSESLDFEEEMDDSKVVKSKRKATTNSKKKGKDEVSPKEEGKKAKQQKSKEKESPSAGNETASTSSDKQNEDDDLAACCLCHCALDYSDRSAFFEADRKQEADKNASGSDEEPLYFQPTDPYLPTNIYDPSNALVYCDTCDRLYHQKCHFVPLMVLPRGKWSCLICTTKKSLTNGSNPGGRGRKKDAVAVTKKDAPFTKHKLSRMFKSPLPPNKLQQYLTAEDGNNKSIGYHTSAEMEWEIATGREKAILWQKTLTHSIPSWIQSQFSNLSQAQTALETLTTTKLNRQHFLGNKASKRGSQELAQTLVKLTGAKWKMRQMVLQMEEIRANPEKHIQLIQQWCERGATSKTEEDKPDATTGSSTALTRPPPKSFMERVIFPFGQYPPRTIPRTPEMQEHLEMEAKKQKEDAEKSSTLENGIPTEIVTSTTTSSAKESPAKSPTKGNKKSEKTHKSPKRNSKAKCKPVDAKDDDSGSGVSLEDLVCAVCLIGDATDENDLLLCDAQGCFRAYHMRCLEPIVTLKEVEATEGEDWFCPLCSGMADCVHKIQSYYMGEEWDRRREARAIAMKKAGKKRKPEKEEENDDEDDDSDEDSLKSWERPTDVFPDSKWEHEAALELKAGKQTDATDALLRLALGEGDEEQQQQGNLLDYLSDGTDDVELDGHFDLESFHEERKREYEEMAGSDDDDSTDDDSSHSSQATLVDMSSVELKIGKDELDCLSQGSVDSDSEDDSGSGSGSDDDGSEGSESGGEVRRSRRIRKLQNPVEIPKSVGVDFDPGNIVQGKRRRKPVDYRKLNDALFGDLDDKENAKLDDKEDFQVQVQPKRVRKKKASNSSGEEGSDDDDGSGDSDNEDNNDGSDVDESNENGKANGKKKKNASRKRSRAPSDDEDVGSGNEAENDDSSVEESKDKKKKSTKKPPAKRKRSAPPKPKKADATSKKKGAKSSEENGKKALKKQNGKKAAGAAKKQNGTKGAKAKEAKPNSKTTTNAKKKKVEGTK